MAAYITPFIVLNVGSEMIFVIAQRLQAQNIDDDKSRIVLDDITSALLSPSIISDLFIPRTSVMSTTAIRQFIETIAHSSVMQLDTYSMNRLWDLITMIYKWQTTMSHNIVEVTRKHLSELFPLISQPATVTLLEKAKLKFEQFVQKFDPAELSSIRSALLIWLNVFRVRVSILLKLGLQNDDGSFVEDDGCDGVYLNPESAALLRNLGTNIFTKDKNVPGVSEVVTFAEQFVGETKVAQNFINVKLDGEMRKKRKELRLECFKVFGNVDCERSTGVEELFDDFKELGIDNENDDFTDDLLNVISEHSIE